MNKKRIVGMVGALLVSGSLASAALAADDHPKEGTVVGIDRHAMMFVVRGSDGDQWTVTWATGTKPLGDLTGPELGLFDRVRFNYKEQDGILKLTELDRESR